MMRGIESELIIINLSANKDVVVENSRRQLVVVFLSTLISYAAVSVVVFIGVPLFIRFCTRF